ncbi:hypothetical protein NQ317_002093 [Molorchus minor]|uniref:Cytochrome P450 n=1 Tax=Molorchus minor TaxID=1323400 RepID=A0ABQ9JX41_9CUCU|nr:hypothetical protein NQ317_002093 [Molorchus minor]
MNSGGWDTDLGGVFLGLRPHLVLADPAYVKDVMTKDFSYFVDRGIYQTRKDPISVNIFSQSGAEWRSARAKFTTIFSSAKMRAMFPMVLDCAAGLDGALENVNQGSDVDTLEMMGCYTTDVIGSCAFGISCNSFKHPDAEFRRMGRKHFEEFTVRDQINLFLSINSPGLADWLGLSNVQQDVAEFFAKSIKDTVEFRENNAVRRNDLLQLLIDTKNSTDDVDDIAAHFDTSATTASMTLYEMSRSSEAQEKAREEIVRIFKKYNDEITYEGIAEMKYLGQAVDETLRLWPPVTTLTRVCTRDYKLNESDLTVKKGVTVLIPVLGLHYDQQYWPDPLRWDPSRFNEENRNDRTPFAYLPFGEGPRNCIALRFGLMQVKIALATILRKYRVSLSPKTVTPLGMDPDTFVLHTINKVYLNFERIEDDAVRL